MEVDAAAPPEELARFPALVGEVSLATGETSVNMSMPQPHFSSSSTAWVAERGMARLRGFEDPVPIVEVRPEELAPPPPVSLSSSSSSSSPPPSPKREGTLPMFGLPKNWESPLTGAAANMLQYSTGARHRGTQRKANTGVGGNSNASTFSGGTSGATPTTGAAISSIMSRKRPMPSRMTATLTNPRPLPIAGLRTASSTIMSFDRVPSSSMNSETWRSLAHDSGVYDTTSSMGAEQRGLSSSNRSSYALAFRPGGGIHFTRHFSFTRLATS